MPFVDFPHGAHDCSLQGQHDEQVDRRIDKARAAPAELLDHESAQRPTDRASKASKQRDLVIGPRALLSYMRPSAANTAS
jgi:hypothetical protein